MLQEGERKGGRRREGWRKEEKSKKKWRKRGREGKTEAKKNVCAHVLSHVATFWTVAHQAPLSMGFFRQEYWSGLPFFPPGDLPDSGIEPASPALQADSSPLNHQGSLAEKKGNSYSPEPFHRPANKVGTLISVFLIEPNCLSILISSFLPQPQAWVKSERKHSFRFQPTNHPWDLAVEWAWPWGWGHTDPSNILNAKLLLGASSNSLGNQNTPRRQFTLALKLLVFIHKQNKEWAVVPPFLVYLL